MDYDEACFMHLAPGVVHDYPKAVGVIFVPYAQKKIPESSLKRAGCKPGNSGLLSQQ